MAAARRDPAGHAGGHEVPRRPVPLPLPLADSSTLADSTAAEAMTAASGTGQPPPVVSVVGDSVADVTERLLFEFGGERDLAVISRMVLGCRAELAGVPEGALPELLERLARQRLDEAPRSAPGRGHRAEIRTEISAVR